LGLPYEECFLSEGLLDLGAEPRVTNDSRALRLGINRIAQYEALKAYGVRTPCTIAAVGTKHIVEAARRMTGPFITKHNRAGKGLGVKLFQSARRSKNT
jgi:glutathione synthase/RimK-type ligase-like ATP-grasp enzyme